MSDLKLYGGYVSPPSRSVHSYFILSNIQFEFVEFVIGKNQFLTPEFKLINPYQCIPAITHNDFNLWESAAIISYISTVYNIDNQWYPKDPKIRSRIDAYLHWHHIGIRSHCELFLEKTVFLPLNGEQKTLEEDDRLKGNIYSMYEDIKWHLADTGYMARTAQATIADIFVFNEVSLIVKYCPLDEGIRRWYDEIASIQCVAELLTRGLEYMNKIEDNLNRMNS